MNRNTNTLRNKEKDCSLHCWDCDVSCVEGISEMKVGSDGAIETPPLCPKCRKARGVDDDGPKAPPPLKPKSIEQMTVSPETSRRLAELGFPTSYLSWYVSNAPGSLPVILPTYTDDEPAGSGDIMRLALVGPAPLAEELVHDLPPGEMAWLSKGGYFCSNRSRGRVGYVNLAEALAHNWIDRRTSPEDDGKKHKRSYSY